MAEAKAKTFPNVTLAFRLGWSLSELMGRARHTWARQRKVDRKAPGQQLLKELKGFADDEAPRLTCSNRYFSPEGAWWQSAVRVVSLAEKLGVLNENEEEIRALPGRIHALTFVEGDESEDEMYSPRDLYNFLEPWGREAGTKLATQSDSAARAFRVGGQIADTYWFMRSKEHYGNPRDWDRQDSWHQLLNHKRLVTIIEDIKLLEDALPPLVGDCLRFSIYRWMIAHDLEYRRKRLILVRDKSKKDPEIPRERGGILEKIDPDDEERIARQLAEQARIWQDLILGTKKPEGYLGRNGRRWALGKAIGRYVLIVAGAVIGLSLTGYALVVLLGGASSAVLAWMLETLTPEQKQPDTLKTSLEIVTKALPLVVGAIVFAASLLRDGWSATRGLWERLCRAAQEQEIRKRTWVPWHRPGAV